MHKQGSSCVDLQLGENDGDRFRAPKRGPYNALVVPAALVANLLAGPIEGVHYDF